MIDIAIHKQWLSPDGDRGLKLEFLLPPGELVTVYGQSGAGKTSLLNMLAGFMRPDKGSIKIQGETWFDADPAHPVNISPQKRRIGYVFQEQALFPNMSVLQNLEYALEKGKDTGRVGDLIELMELQSFLHRRPVTLSGGEKQRVSLARALVRDPAVLLLDEPFSALDHDMRYKMQDYMISIHKRYRLSILMVSHDLSEIVRVSDRVLWLEQGRIKEQGKPFDIFSGRRVSGKFRFTGEVLQVLKEDVVYVVDVLVGREMVKVVCTEEEAVGLFPGLRVYVVSKAFNPFIERIG